MNQPPLSILGRMKPSIKAQIQENYDKLVKNRNFVSLKLRKQIKEELDAFNKSKKELIPKSQTKLYEKIEREHRLACETEKLRHIGTSRNFQSLIAKHKKAFIQEINTKIPHLKELKEKKRLLVSNLSTLFESVTPPSNPMGHIRVAIGDLSILEDDTLTDPTTINFTPPYPLTENYHDIVFESYNSLEVDSRVDQNAGLLIHQISSKHEENAWLMLSRAKYDVYTSVGVNYALPRTGTLSVDVFIQNLVNEHRLSLTDNFGFSDGYATLTNSLYLNIVHPNNVAPFEIEMNHLEIESDGDDISRSDINVLDTEFSRWINFRSTGSLAEGTKVQIYIGNKDSNYSILNEMECRSETRFSWFVRNIVVRTV